MKQIQMILSEKQDVRKKNIVYRSKGTLLGLSPVDGSLLRTKCHMSTWRPRIGELDKYAMHVGLVKSFG